jgi:hypothetical protein
MSCDGGYSISNRVDNLNAQDRIEYNEKFPNGDFEVVLTNRKKKELKQKEAIEEKEERDKKEYKDKQKASDIRTQRVNECRLSNEAKKSVKISRESSGRQAREGNLTTLVDQSLFAGNLNKEVEDEVFLRGNTSLGNSLSISAGTEPSKLTINDGWKARKKEEEKMKSKKEKKQKRKKEQVHHRVFHH